MYAHSQSWLLALLRITSQIFAQGTDCGTSATVYTNASDTSTSYDPWTLPFGTFAEFPNTYLWTLDTVSYNIHGRNGSAEQRLWLSTQVQMNLVDPNFGFVGCGMVLHGLRHGAIERGQDDDGTCGSILDEACLVALDNSTNLTSQSLTESTLAKDGPTALELCDRLSYLGPGGRFGLPDECSNSFLDDAWIQTFVFASPEVADICATDPGASDATDPLAAWGAGSYNTDDMRTYDNLTTSVTPLIVSIITNRTVNNTEASQHWAAQDLMCLRPSRIEIGSATPAQIPNASTRMRSSSGWATCLFLFAVLSSCLTLL